MTSTPEKKLLKGGESLNQGIPALPMFVGYALVLGKTSYISVENVQDFCIQKVFCHPLKTSLYFSSPAIRRWMLSFVNKTVEGIHFHLFYFFFHVKQWEHQHLHQLHYFCHCTALYITLSSKPAGKIATMCFDWRRWAAVSFRWSLSEWTLQFLLKEFYF